MSVVRVVDKYASRGGSATVHGRRQYTRILLFECDSTADNEQTIFAGGAPFKYEGYPGDAGALCKKVEPKRGDTLANGHVIWEAVCHYDSQLEEPDQDEENPLDRPQIESASGAIFTETQFEDLEGNAYVNSAGAAVGGRRRGDPLDPPPLVEVTHTILTIQRNEATFDLGLAHYYRNKVNSDAFYGAGPKYAKVASIGAHGPQYENGVTFYVVTYEIHFNPNKWIPTKILDAGPRYIDDNAALVHVTDDNGTQSTIPVLLDGNGQKLADGAAPHYVEFRQYQLAPFSGMNLQ